jgi:hypothetical protein
MNKILINLVLMIALIAWGCKEKKQDENHDHHNHEATDDTELSENAILDREVMKIHDEVMPKIDAIIRKKEELKNKIATTPKMPAEEKQRIEALIVKLDSAGDGMMVWMRNYNPPPDSQGEEKAREYLENEMEKIKKVRQDMVQALEEAEKE